MAQKFYDKHVLCGFEFGARKLKEGKTFVRWELRKFHDQPWPGDAALLKHFGECGLGGTVRHAGRTAFVEVIFD